MLLTEANNTLVPQPVLNVIAKPMLSGRSLITPWQWLNPPLILSKGNLALRL